MNDAYPEEDYLDNTRICPLCNKTTTRHKCPECGTGTVVMHDSLAKSRITTGHPIVLEQYEVHELIAKGGSAKVYSGIKTDKQFKVAIKIINKNTITTAADLKRMKRGVLACSLLNHPNIVKVYDYGETDSGEPVIVMEYINGKTLREILNKEGPLDTKTTILILKQLAEALNYSHNQDIIHRDIKPDNIMLEPDKDSYRITLADFGVARWFKGGRRLKGGRRPSYTTVKGVSVGTPSYMSPEQINGLTDLDGRADIYGLGVVAYETLTGTNPFRHDELMDTLRAHLIEPIPDFPENIVKTAPASLLKVIKRMLHKDRTRRIQSAASLIKALSTIQD